jgi:hypothetical protein
MDEIILRRLDELIEIADRLARQASGRGENGREFYAELSGWRARGLTAVGSIVGESHPYYLAFDAEAKSGYESSAGDGAAILKALRADVQAGYLRRQEDLVAGAVFSDFLDMAGHLLGAGYYHPAASLIGAVLEDALRRIATNSAVAIGRKDDINALSSKLREKGTFSPLVAKRVTLWADIRNNADHGHFDLVTEADVREMYQGVTAFIAERLG